jgi:hypothetical protein
MIPTQNGWSDAAEAEREAQVVEDSHEIPHSVEVMRILAELEFERYNITVDKSTNRR